MEISGNERREREQTGARERDPVSEALPSAALPLGHELPSLIKLYVPLSREQVAVPAKGLLSL